MALLPGIVATRPPSLPYQFPDSAFLLLKHAENLWLRMDGRFVDIGGRSLRIDCAGAGSPSVILEAGLEQSGRGWHAVQSGVSAFTRVCSYDRAGLGNSDPAQDRRDVHAVVRDLNALLEKARVPGPYILVGHSFGSVIVRVHAVSRPGNVGGIVLIEPVVENQFPFVAAEMDDLEREAYWKREAGGNREKINVIESAFEASRISHPDVQTILVTALLHDRKPRHPRWKALYMDFAQRIRASEHRFAERSSHFVHTDQPEIVIDAIRTLVERVRLNQNTVVGIQTRQLLADRFASAEKVAPEK
jgi:pimeloyl-ACP methyl ester carboxylesterase